MAHAIIPGLPDDLSARCLAFTPYIVRQKLRSVCKLWRESLVSVELLRIRTEVRNGILEALLCFSTGAHVDNGSCCLIFKLYDYEEACWCPLPPLRIWDSVGYSLKSFQCCGVSGGVVVAGGELSTSLNEDSLVSKAVWFFDLWEFRWYRLPDMQHLRSFPCMTAVGSTVAAISSQPTYFVTSMSSIEFFHLDRRHWHPSTSATETRSTLHGMDSKWNLREMPQHGIHLPNPTRVDGCFVLDSELHILRSVAGGALLETVYDFRTDIWRMNSEERFTQYINGAKVLALSMIAGSLYALMSVKSVPGICHSSEERMVSVVKHNHLAKDWDHVAWLPITDKGTSKRRKRPPLHHLLGANGKLFVLQSELTRSEASLPLTTLHVLNIAGESTRMVPSEVQILNRFMGLGQKRAAWEVIDVYMDIHAEIACSCVVSL